MDNDKEWEEAGPRAVTKKNTRCASSSQVQGVTNKREAARPTSLAARPLGARGLEMSTEIFVMGRAPGRAGVSRVSMLLDLHLADADEVHDHQQL